MGGKSKKDPLARGKKFKRGREKKKIPLPEKEKCGWEKLKKSPGPGRKKSPGLRKKEKCGWEKYKGSPGPGKK